MQRLTMYTDGGSRGNPGPAACGVVIYNELGDEVARLKKTIGVATNNQAEYQAVVLALEWINQNYGQTSIAARLDSELVVRQLNGQYKIKNDELKPWMLKIKALVHELGGQVTFDHVPRSQNKVADSLVNEALDAEVGTAIK